MDEKLIQAITRLAAAIEKQNALASESLAAQRKAMDKADGMQTMLNGMLRPPTG